MLTTALMILAALFIVAWAASFVWLFRSLNRGKFNAAVAQVSRSYPGDVSPHHIGRLEFSWVLLRTLPSLFGGSFFFVLTYPFYIGLTSLGMIFMAWDGKDARVLETGIEVFSKRKGVISWHDWSEVQEIAEVFCGPMFVREIVLKSGERVRLEMADRSLLEQAAKAHGVPFSSDH